DDHYTRCLRLSLIRTIDRIEISIVHQSLSQAFEARNLRESWFFLQTAMVRSAANRRPPLSSEPETDQQNQDKRGHTEPGDHDDFDPYFAHLRNVIVHARVAVKKPVTVAKDISAE